MIIASEEFTAYEHVGKRTIKTVYKYADVDAASVWCNVYGNPTWGLIMSDDTRLRLVDDYGFCPSYVHCHINYVSRKRDLF